MKKNVGPADQFTRFLIGLGFIMNIFTINAGIIGTIVFLVLAGSMFYSAFSGYCFLYSILNWSTCKEACAPAPENTQAPSH